MHRTGHYGVSLILYAPVWVALLALDHLLFALGGLAVVIALAHVPDYDEALPFVRHRGPTHTFAFAWLVGVVVAFAAITLATGRPVDRVVVAGFGFGVGVLAITAHLFGDLLTPAGVELLWPFSRRRYSLHFGLADEPIANYAVLGVGVCVTVVSGVALAA